MFLKKFLLALFNCDENSFIVNTISKDRFKSYTKYLISLYILSLVSVLLFALAVYKQSIFLFLITLANFIISLFISIKITVEFQDVICKLLYRINGIKSLLLFLIYQSIMLLYELLFILLVAIRLLIERLVRFFYNFKKFIKIKK